MHDNDIWQIYADNGTPIPGKGADRAVFNADPNLGMGNVHIWFWKQNDTTTEILLQKRALGLRNRPGWYHISAGGHINVDETPLQAALRETEEEMGLKLNPDMLHFVQSVKIVTKDPRDLVHVYLYRLNGDETFTCIDGEVDSYEWRTLDNFKHITEHAEENNLIPQGQLYFGTLIAALEYVAQH